MRTVVVRMHNCQILTGGNIFFVHFFCFSILFFFSSECAFSRTFEIAGPSESV